MGSHYGDSDSCTGMGEVITVCQPHYDETINIGNLLGMACADVTLAMLQVVGADLDVSDNLSQIFLAVQIVTRSCHPAGPKVVKSLCFPKAMMYIQLHTIEMQ